MVVIKNVAIIGASGALGKRVLNAIVNSGLFNVTILSRSATNSGFPPSVKVLEVDYSSVSSLTTALEGQDAVVSTVGTAGLLGQNIVIDAAIAAGVKRFIPSEFGSDLANPKTKQLPVFGYKVATLKYLEEKIQSYPEFTYTTIRNGVFLDWALEAGVLLEWKEGKPRLFDGGDKLFSATTLDSVGVAVVGVLSHYDDTVNRPVYVQDIVTSQNRILAVAKKINPEKKWEPVFVDVEALLHATNEKMAKGEGGPHLMYQYLVPSIFGDGYGARMGKVDNELLGVAGDKTEADIEVILKPLLSTRA